LKTIISQKLIAAMLEFARSIHPHEIILLLRGKIKKTEIIVEEFLLPPFATYGKSFSEFPLHVLPIDFSIVGTAHSHPSGINEPSIRDINNFYSRIMLILAYPYQKNNVKAFNSRGEIISLEVSTQK
jgi:proteasome lid subunit RPN8/RPN11